MGTDGHQGLCMRRLLTSQLRPTAFSQRFASRLVRIEVTPWPNVEVVYEPIGIPVSDRNLCLVCSLLRIMSVRAELCERNKTIVHLGHK